MSRKLCLIMCFVFVVGTQTVFAASGPIPGVSAVASCEDPWGTAADPEGRFASKTVDGSGMDETFTYHVTYAEDWYDGGLPMWLAGKGWAVISEPRDANGHDNPNPGTVAGIQWIRFEMPAVIEMDSMWVWNYNQVWIPKPSDDPNWKVGHYRGLRNVTIEYSVTGGSDSSEWTSLFDGEFPMANDPLLPDPNLYTGFAGPAFGGTDVKYVVITANDVNGSWGGVGDPNPGSPNYDPNLYYGLSEVRFIGAAPIAVAHEPANGAEDVDHYVDLSWLEGKYAVTHDVYVGTDYDEVLAATRGSHPGMVYFEQDWATSSYAPDPPQLELATTYFWKIDEVNASGGVQWPSPASMVVKFTTAERYIDVVIPSSIIEVAAPATYSGNAVYTADGNGLDPTNRFHSNIVPNHMWSATAFLAETHPGCTSGKTWLKYIFDDVYTLGDLWVWNYNEENVIDQTGLGFKDVYVHYSTTNGSSSGDWPLISGGAAQFTRAPSPATGWNVNDFTGSALNDEYDPEKYAHDTEVDLGGANAQYVVLQATSNWDSGFFYGLSEVIFHTVVPHATLPGPIDDGYTDDPDVVLSWKAGDGAVTHNVYFGTNPRDLPQVATLPGGTTTYDPCDTDSSTDLQWGVRYYWRIDEHNGTDLYSGNLLSFVMGSYIIVDDMESASSNWAVAGAANGAVAVHDSTSDPVPYNQRALQFDYDNTAGSLYSEIKAPIASLPIGADWTIKDMKSLSVKFFGDIDNDQESMYIGLDDGSGVKVVNYDNNDLINLTLTKDWFEWTIDLADFNALGITLSSIVDVYIGFGDRTAPSAGGSGTVYFDDFRLYTSRCIYDQKHHDGDIVGEDCLVDELDLKEMGAEWLLGAIPPSTDGLCGHWTFDEAVVDANAIVNSGSCGTAADGTLVGDANIVYDPIRDSNVLYLPLGTASVADNYLDLGGERLLIDPPTWSDMTDFSIAMWFKSDLYLDEYASGWIQLGGKTDEGDYGDESYPPSTWYAEITTVRDWWEFKTYGGDAFPEGQQATAGPLSAYPDDKKWHHFIGTMDNDYTKMYIDGLLVAEIENNTPRLWGLGPTYIGALKRWIGEEDNLAGMIDDVRIYSRALPAAEITGIADIRPPADINGDKKVNFADYAYLALNYLQDPLLWP